MVGSIGGSRRIFTHSVSEKPDDEDGGDGEAFAPELQLLHRRGADRLGARGLGDAGPAVSVNGLAANA